MAIKEITGEIQEHNTRSTLSGGRVMTMYLDGKRRAVAFDDMAIRIFDTVHAALGDDWLFGPRRATVKFTGWWKQRKWRDFTSAEHTVWEFRVSGFELISPPPAAIPAPALTPAPTPAPNL